jgi:DNA polymerase elongation subunit (family B)
MSTDQQSKDVLETIDNQTIEQLTATSEHYKVMQLAAKAIINDFYGTFGNDYYYFSDKDIAETITTLGRDLIFFGLNITNHYFRKLWPKDTTLHQRLGIENYTIHPVYEHIDTGIYTDTDSIYVWIRPAIDSIEGISFESEQQESEFCLHIVKRLEEYYEKCFEKYAKHYNTYNHQKFELEKFANRGIWLAKKQYVLNLEYKDGDWINPEISSTGVETISSAYPYFVRKLIEQNHKTLLFYGDVIQDVPSGEAEYTLDDIIDDFKTQFEKFKLKSIDNIAFNVKMTAYEKYINSEKNLDLEKGITFPARCAAYYNHIIEVNNAIDKYSKLQSKQDIQYYFCDTERAEFEGIAFPPGEFPMELMPPIDYSYQFYMIVIVKVNRMLEAMGLHPIDHKFNRKVKIEKGKKKDYYPLYVMHEEKLEYEQIPDHLAEYINYPDSEVPESIYPEYLYYLNYYNNKTRIVPNSGVQKFIDKEIKKLERKKEKENQAGNE